MYSLLHDHTIYIYIYWKSEKHARPKSEIKKKLPQIKWRLNEGDQSSKKDNTYDLPNPRLSRWRVNVVK